MMPIRDLLQSLPLVVARRMNAREGFFTAGRMFALLGESNLLLRLPIPTSTAVVEAELGRVVVDSPAPSTLNWVTVPLTALNASEFHDLVLTAHQAVRRVSRRDRSPARRRRARAAR